MKNVKIKKETWRELCQIKSKRNLSNLSKVIEYLINSQHVLKGEKQHRTKELEHDEKTLQNLEEIIREIEEHVDHLQLERHGPIPDEASFPDNIIFMCLNCAEAFKFSKKDQNEMQGIQCHNCSAFNSIQIYSWLPNLEDENEIKKQIK